MGIISYAQNFEDVMLWRALKDIENGFYIDVGANDPTVDSVSRAFYEQGWRGVHVEPSPEFAEKLRDQRPDEIVEQYAVGSDSGDLIFFQFEDTGLSTADIDVAKKHKESGFNLKEIKVKSVTLDYMLDKHSQKTVHWLKIDVEGYEKEVLSSWKESQVRPWILIIESTRPLSTEESFEDWEDLVINKGYIFAYFDGLNRFYVHENHKNMINEFRIPPNIFDRFELSGTATSSMCSTMIEQCNKLSIEKDDAESRAAQAETRAAQAELKIQQALKELTSVYESRSWRITSPLRWFVFQIHLIRVLGFKARFLSLLTLVKSKVRYVALNASDSKENQSEHTKRMLKNLMRAKNKKRDNS